MSAPLFRLVTVTYVLPNGVYVNQKNALTGVENAKVGSLVKLNVMYMATYKRLPYCRKRKMYRLQSTNDKRRVIYLPKNREVITMWD